METLMSLLERFSPLEDRLRGAQREQGDWFFEVRPVSDAVRVSGRVDHGFLATDEPIANRSELHFRGPSGASWVWRAPSEEIDAPGFRLRVKTWAEEKLDRVDEALFRLELPVDSR